MKEFYKPVKLNVETLNNKLTRFPNIAIDPEEIADLNSKIESEEIINYNNLLLNPLIFKALN